LQTRIRRLSAAQVKKLQSDAEDLAAKLVAERGRAEAAATERAAAASELASLREQAAAEVGAERQHYERLLQVGAKVLMSGLKGAHCMAFFLFGVGWGYCNMWTGGCSGRRKSGSLHCEYAHARLQWEKEEWESAL
jgi:hypothetical protein